MVKLVCALVAVKGSAFPVEIEASQLVGDLKDAIKQKNEDITCAARKLKLYLAKRGGEWLKSSTNDVKELKKGTLTTTIEELTHEDKELQGESGLQRVLKGMPAPSDEQIHVLVDAREGLSGSASDASTMAQLANEIHEVHKEVVQTKRKRYVHSQITSEKGRALLQELNIRIVTVKAVPFPVSKARPVPKFKWESICDLNNVVGQTEEQHRKRYLAYVEQNIGDILVEKDLCVFGLEKGMDILTAKVPGHDIDLVGRTDLLVMNSIVKEHSFEVQLLPDVKLLIEVKRTVKNGSIFQAVSELIALDVLTSDPVMALLTNLTDVWKFFWVGEKRNTHIIYTTTLSTPGDAFEVIRTLLAQSTLADTEIEEISLPCLEEPLKRRKLTKMMNTIGEGCEMGSIRECFEQYNDIKSVLGPDIDMARALARQVTRRIPVFNYFT